MNALAAITGPDLVGTLTAAAKGPTLRDVHRWAWTQEVNSYPHFLWAVEAIWRFEADEPISKVKPYLQGRIAFLKPRAADGNTDSLSKLTPTIEMVRHIERFEQRHARAA